MSSNINDQFRSVKEIRDLRLCHGCGICEVICKENAIKLEYRERYRTYVPIINSSLCSQCGLCVKVCSGHSVKFKDLSEGHLQGLNYDIRLGNYRHCYVGWSTDQKMRFRASSGGIATALVQFLLETRSIDRVLVVLPDKGRNPVDFKGQLISKKEDALNAMGSKYCPVSLCGALKDMNKGEKIAIVGLPCHIHSIRKATKLKKNLFKEQPLLIGLFCGAQIGRKGTEWFLKKNGKRTEDLCGITYRGHGWPGHINARFKNGEEINEPMHRFKDAKYLSYVPWRCKLCSDALSELADISVGDAWLKEIKEHDQIGSSIIISRSIYGDNVLKGAMEANNICLNTIPAKDVIRSQHLLLANKKRHIYGGMLLAKMLRRGIPAYDNLDRSNRCTWASFLYRIKRELKCFIARNIINTHTYRFAIQIHNLRNK